MTSILTGDIANSRKLASKSWTEPLKQLLNTKSSTPAGWEIYRGDEFQLEIPNPQDALLTAFHIKARLKMLKVDLRMAIGIGDKNHTAAKISESNGPAFIRSGETFETLKKYKTTLAVSSGNATFDAELNLMIRLGLTFMDNWLAQPAEFVVTALENPNASQEEIGQRLGINQAAVSRRRKRAQFDLMMELDAHFRKKITSL